MTNAMAIAAKLAATLAAAMPAVVAVPASHAAAVAVAAAVAFPLAPGVARAQAERAAPDRVVQAAVESVMRSIQADPATRDGDLGRIEAVVRRDFLPHTDFARTARLAAGDAWQSATPAQREALAGQFREMMVRIYAASLAQLRQQDVRFRFRLASGKPDAKEAIVESRMVDNTADMQVDYRLRRGDDGWKIYDINMMGAWLVDIYRRQFADLISRGGIDGLIAHLARHNARQPAQR